MSTKPGELEGDELDRELADLLEVDAFEPSAEFRVQARVSDSEIYEEAVRDPQAWWARQAEELDWFRRWDTVLDDSNPPFSSGSWAVSSTSPTTAWTVTCLPAAAIVWRCIGVGRRGGSVTSPMRSCSPRSNA
jgi:hypothetical protein